MIVAMLPDPAAAAIKAYREAGYPIAAPVQQLVPPRLPAQSAWRARQRPRGLVRDPGGQGSVRTGLRGSLQGGDRRDAGNDVVGRLRCGGDADARGADGVARRQGGDGRGHPRRPRQDQRSEGSGRPPTVADFAAAAKAAANGEPINYEGAFHAIDWDARGDMFPPLVHWKVENGRFVEYELYRCGPQQPLCPSK